MEQWSVTFNLPYDDYLTFLANIRVHFLLYRVIYFTRVAAPTKYNTQNLATWR